MCICHRTGRPVTKGSVLASWSAAEPTFALLDARIARRKSILRNAGQLTSVKHKQEVGKPVLAARADDQVGRAGRPCRDGGRSSPDTPDTTNQPAAEPRYVRGGGISAASAGRTERADFRPARRLHRAGNFNGMVLRRSCQRIRMRPSACSCAINRSRGSSGAN